MASAEQNVSSVPVSHLKVCVPANPEGAKVIDGRYQRLYIVMADGSEVDISVITRAVRPEIVAGEVSRCHVEFIAYELAPLTVLPVVQ